MLLKSTVIKKEATRGFLKYNRILIKTLHGVVRQVDGIRKLVTYVKQNKCLSPIVDLKRGKKVTILIAMV